MILDCNVRDPASVRDYVIDALRRELVGPAPGYPLIQTNGEEVLRPQDPPRYRYACGILFPHGVTYSGSLDASDDEAAIESSGTEDAEPDLDRPDASGADRGAGTGTGTDQEPEVDPELNAASTFLPSTMGMSFLADVSGGLEFESTWGTYRKEKLPGYAAASGGPDPEPWFRHPGRSTVCVDAATLSSRSRWGRTLSGERDQGTLVLDVVSRPWGNGRRLITATLVNATRRKGSINESCFYQCKLAVRPLTGSRVFPYPGRPVSSMDAEEAGLTLLYRHRPTYAVGHGCAANWEIADAAVEQVTTDVLPVFEQAPILPREDVAGVELSMKRLSVAPERDVIDALRHLADAYRGWIAGREAELEADSTISAELKASGSGNIALCRECLSRIEDGTALLADDLLAMEAFQLMNLAMVQQREHYRLSVTGRSWVEADNGEGAVPETPYVAPTYPEETRWRPFQLAFILMNVRAFLEPSHRSRTVADLIWFPTGGGKTEAYLGLAAFAILVRRLREPSNAGTTVLMRYTLRLLTTQQFQRAASLVCALERMRRQDSPRFGTVPISIGLWLGGAVTPNRHAQAVKDYERLAREGGENPFVVLSCPWCGAAMGAQPYGDSFRVFGYRLQKRPGGRDRIQFRCEDLDCDFHSEEGLPLEVVDDAIYERPPTLVIGTVDKFAMMPWEPRSRLIFGIDNPEASEPPALIIQDELHLISGPLGSMVGHYETVIDDFCTNQSTGIPAKIIASTATIARANDQIAKLYGRPSMLFPPQGLVAGETFFGYEGTDVPGRTYVGVLATALPSHVTSQVRTLASILQAPALAEGPEAAKDPYWTLMVYFNSLRELGRASTLVQADITEHLNALRDRIGLTKDFMPDEYRSRRRFINVFEELTSRLQSRDIPRILKKLFAYLPAREVVDLCYATNMIQVGLDVPRLSLMSIVGQPKGASEYIQASSRVGRDPRKPGLVVTNYNAFKPRDRSHFESFRSFHENAYRHVEPTSVTPFSIPVCERAIHALAVSVARFKFPELRDSPARGVHARRQKIVKVIMDRINRIAPEEAGRAAAILDRFLDDWERRRPQGYGDMSGSDDDPLLWPAGRRIPPHLVHLGEILRATPSSMRNVDAECEAVPVQNYVPQEIA